MPAVRPGTTTGSEKVFPLSEIYEFGEDYLEAILMLSQTLDRVRAIDIVHKLLMYQYICQFRDFYVVLMKNLMIIIQLS